MSTYRGGFWMRLPGMLMVWGLVMAFAPRAAWGQITCTVDATTDTGATSGTNIGDIVYCLNQANANPGSTIIFASSLNGQIIALSNTLGITAGMTIQGPGANQLTISGGNAVEVFWVNNTLPSSTVTISGLTIANGNGHTGPGGLGGGGIFNSGTLTVKNCTFSGNTAPNGVGGGILNEGALTVTNSTFTDNSAAEQGGGIYNESNLTLTSSTFSGNTAEAGGGIGNTAPLTVSDSTFSGNSATAGNEGGGIFNSGGLTVKNSILTNDSGGECYTQSASACPTNGSNGNVVEPYATTRILAPLGWYGGTTSTMIPLASGSSSGFINPAVCAGSTSLLPAGVTTDERGFQLDRTCASGRVDAGAVQANFLTVNTTTDQNDTPSDCVSGGNGECSLRDAMNEANTSAYASGADIAFASGVMGTIDLTTLDAPLAQITGILNLMGPGANLLAVSGGGSTNVGSIFEADSGSFVAISGLTIAAANATVPVYGGGILNKTGYILSGTPVGLLTVANCTFTGNSLSGIENDFGTAMVTNSTFTGNSAPFGDGGGIDNGGAMTVSNSTFFGNSAQVVDGGGIYNGPSATLTVANSTLTGNSAPNGQGGGIYNNGGALTVTNSVLTGDTPSECAGPGTGCPSAGIGTTTGNVVGATTPEANLASLGNYGGPTQTYLPLPGYGNPPATGTSPSVAICAGVPALAAGLLTDQRGFPRVNTSYTNAACVDSGAVQTKYQSVQFANLPASGDYLGVVSQGPSIAPIVSVTENGQSIAGVPITLTFTGNGTASGLTETTVASVGATFNDLSVNAVGSSTLSTALEITPAFSIQASAGLEIATSPATLSTNSLTFGPQGVGSESTQTVTLTNFGSAALTIWGITTNGYFFQTNDCGAALNASGSCVITVTFRPLSVGAFTGALNISDIYNSGASQQTVALSGTALVFTEGPNPPVVLPPPVMPEPGEPVSSGGATSPVGAGPGRPVHSPLSSASPLSATTTTSTVPVARLSSSSLVFTGQAIGTSSSAQTVTLTNPTDVLMPISSISVSGDFSQTNDCGAALEPGARCTISVTFKPKATGTRPGTLTVSEDPSSSPQTLTLRGKAVALTIGGVTGTTGISDY